MIGLIFPLPAYVASPIGLSILSGSVILSAIMAFIISSHLMNPIIFFLAASQINLDIAIVRTVLMFFDSFTHIFLEQI